MRVRRPDDEPFEIPLIPMIDCMLVIIIFFLVATTLKHHARELPVELPDSTAAVEAAVPPDVLVIGVDRAGATWLGEADRPRPVSTEQLHQNLRDAARDNPGRRIRVDADRAAPFEYVVRVLDLCEFEGLRNVGLHTRSEPENRR